VSGVWWSSVLLLARVTTRSRSSGGKAPGSAGAWGVLQTGETAGDEAFPPLADCVAVAVEFVRELLVGKAVRRRRAEDEPAAEDQGLRRGTGADQGVQLLLEFGGEDDGGREGSWHMRLPWCREATDRRAEIIMGHAGSSVQSLAANL
jgi:hypothetical protein